ncbi:relaxase/mobilization nuclease domain-containing protein [Streptomyces carpaticus]|uniref:relaxase/mobilization nuclease domain-containing protein n=1 Tax=Streptomyces carpaticus TaxID=285558 RepID=UPI0031F77691
MIPKIARRGSRTIGLLTYLYGPGIRDEHTDPHLVASFGSDAPDPGRDPAATLKDLAVLLDQPVRALPEPNQPKRHVWHCSVRTDPGDRQLSDDEWETVAHRIVTATGIEDPATGRYCRWAAVRHAPDHIHIVATLICEDGRRPRLHQDAARAQAECRRIETEWGLRLLNAGDGTAAQRPTSAERHKADRRHHDRTPREQLREAVRTALAGATSGEEFFDRLADQGVHVYQRHAPSGDLLGYNVALPGDRTADGSLVWFSGSKLAPDLSWPRIQQRFTTLPPPPPTPQTTPAGARRAAADMLWDATHHLGEGDSASDAAHLAAASEVLDALATTSPRPTRAHVRAAARSYDRAARSHVRAAHQHSRALRRTARAITFAGPALGRGEDGAAAAMLLSTLVLFVIAAHRWHTARGHQQQAAAARQAAEHLRQAYGIAAGPDLAALAAQGRALPPHTLDGLAESVRAAAPAIADTIVTEPGWPGLAAVLENAARRGSDPVPLLQEVVGHRELTTADSLSGVLIWRLHRRGTAPAPTHRGRPRTADGPSTAAAAPATENGTDRRR